MWMNWTDLTWLILAGRTVCNTSRAAVKVLEDDFFSLNDQLTNAACKQLVQRVIQEKNMSKKNYRLRLMLGYFTNETRLDASSLSKDCVVWMAPHMQLLIQIKALEFSLSDRQDTITKVPKLNRGSKWHCAEIPVRCQ